MAHKQGGGSTKNNRDSKSKRLGIKVFSNQKIKKGGIIVRQRGLLYKRGCNVEIAKDFTIFSLIDGFVDFNNFIVSVNEYQKNKIFSLVAQW